MVEQRGLYIVSTPIGNLSDLSYRAVQILKDVDLILSEDTRETDKLLKHYSINTPQISYRDQNHDRIISKILDNFENGSSMALLSDSGTPLISDPGYKLVKELIKNNVPVMHIPGASAVIASLVVSGLPTDKFTFLGFLPKSHGSRIKLLQTYGDLDSTLVVFESPYRIVKLLQEVSDQLGERYVCLVKDQTKLYENIVRGNVSEVLNNVKSLKLKGEFVLLIGKKDFSI